MNVLNKYFDKVFLISIPRNAERLKDICSRVGDLEYEIFWGIDGHELYPELNSIINFPSNFFIENKLDYGRVSMWNKGQLGCAMSNRLVHEKIVTEKINRVLIIEDDIVLDFNQLDNFLSKVIELPNDWELLYLGYRELNRVFIKRNVRILNWVYSIYKHLIIEGCSNRNSNNNFYPKKYSSSFDIPGVYYGTHAYALSLAGAKILLEIDTPLRYGFDILLLNACYYNKIKGYSFYKKVAFPSSAFPTTLTN